jgi:hypothetical protein
MAAVLPDISGMTRGSCVSEEGLWTLFKHQWSPFNFKFDLLWYNWRFLLFHIFFEMSFESDWFKPKNTTLRHENPTLWKIILISSYNCHCCIGNNNSIKNVKFFENTQTVLDHFTEKSFHRFFFTKTPFDRTPFDRMPSNRKFIRPNRRLTEGRLTESSFYRKKSFDRNKIYQKVVGPKIYGNGRLTENLTWKLVNWPKWQMIIFRKSFRLYELSVK